MLRPKQSHYVKTREMCVCSLSKQTKHAERTGFSVVLAITLEYMIR